MRGFYLRDCAAGDILEDVFVISGKQFAAGSNGKYYIKATIGDRSASLQARMWNASKPIFATMPDPGFIKLRGRVENYQNNLQVIIEQVWEAKDGTFDTADLMPHTSKNIEQMCRELHEICGSIQNRHLAALVQTYLEDEPLMANFCKAPAAMNMHHAFIGGLLEHTLNAMQVGDAIVKFYPGLSRDLLLTGIFLHDIAKTWELSYECAFGYTDGGHLVGHIVKSAMWVGEKAKLAEQALGEPIPPQVVEVLQHIILSHHGKLENAFGSARNPMTPEAMMVGFIDDMDAKMMIALSATRGDAAATAEGNWTDWMKALNVKLYRPDVAPEDAPVSEEAHVDSKAPESDAPAMKMSITNPLFESTSSPRKK